MKIAKKQSARVWIVAGLLVAPILYILSLGPVARWTNTQDDSNSAMAVLSVVYAPITSMIEAPIVGPFLEAYCELWIDPESVWSSVCEFAASEPALQFLGVPKTVSVSRVFVGGATPRMGVDFDLDVHASELPASPVQLTSFAAKANPAASRFELKIARPPAGPEDSGQPAVLLASADEYTEWRELSHLSGSPPEPSGRIFELRGNVRFKAPEESLEIGCDQANVEFTFEKGSTTAIEYVALHLSGNVRWTSGDFRATAQTLVLALQRRGPGSETSSDVPFTVIEFSQSPRFSSGTTTGQAVEMSFRFDSAQTGAFGIPASVRLSGNAVVETTQTSEKPAERASGDRLRFRPVTNEVRYD